MSLKSLGFTGAKTEELKEGDTFDILNGVPICEKYVIQRREPRISRPGLKPRVDERLFPKHFDSMQYLRICDNIPEDADVVVTQKLHGTSVRIGNVPVKRTLTWRDKLARKLGVKIQEHVFDNMYGSRNVIMDANNPAGYYDHDLWSDTGKLLDGVIPQNYVVYGEIIGWTDGGKAIQKHYTYDCHLGTRKLYIYRVSFVNAQGTVADLSWDALKSFCLSTGLTYVPELWRGKKRHLEPEKWVDINLAHDGWDIAVPLADDSPCDEGVCIRIEGMIPEIYKLKSPMFLQMETALLDESEKTGYTDLESEQSE
jgi:hypothetical protein